MTIITEQGEYVPTRVAAQRAGFTQVHVSRLCNERVLETLYTGSQYLVSVRSLDAYLALPRRRGRKPRTAA